MDYPVSKAEALRLDAGKFKDRVGATKGSVIPAVDWANPVTDEIIAAVAGAGLTATEGQNDQLSAAIGILARGGALGFRVKARNPADLSVDIEAGTFFDTTTGLLVPVGASSVGPIAAPIGNPRNDIVYIDALTGAPGIQAGAEAGVPLDPALPLGKLPAGRINAYPGMTEITAADLDELRYLGSAGIDPFTPKLASRNIWTAGQAGAVEALTDAASIAVDMALSNNFTVTLAGNRTLDNPTNQVGGQSGIIEILQDATGGRTLTFGTDWKFEGGITPPLSTAANARDVLAYYIAANGVLISTVTRSWS